MRSGYHHIWTFFACLMALLVFSGCAGQKGLIVLVPEKGKPVGEVTVVAPKGSQVMNQPWQAVEISGGEARPTGPGAMDEAQFRSIFGEAQAAMPASPICFVLYFKMDTAVLTAESKLLLPEIIKAIKERHPAELSIIGHTDTIGSSEYNYRLGLTRAKTVTEILKSMGAAPVTTETFSHGKGDLLVKTGDQVDEPRNRRVEVTIR
ncbi:MAG TPA: OmpA family protein [Geobacteraceae bacterium]|nr:OmpA family protein [Geobacteraceae bacterium]